VLEVMASRSVLPSANETVSLPGPAGGQPVAVPAFSRDPRTAPGMPPRLGRRIDRFSALAYLTVTDLVASLAMPEPGRVGVFFANTYAGWSYAEPQIDSMVRTGPWSVQPYFVTAWFPTAATGEVTIALGYQGPSKTTTGRLSGFAEALWLARDALDRQAVDVALVGAVESVVTPFALHNWPAGDLPADGAAEGAVVFALRALPAAQDRAGCATLSDLRYDDADRTTSADRDWIPALSIAAQLARSAASPDGELEVPLGGGYRATLGAAPQQRAGTPG
jgi:3-oxoacyl-(acyl-carrier-protein) synthase